MVNFLDYISSNLTKLTLALIVVNFSQGKIVLQNNKVRINKNLNELLYITKIISRNQSKTI